ncbi:MAG TPA: carboxypeptidase-like regulatory domain-containing protein [Polyangiaceae bacterium]|nr:carboxypeptidase-like regulatory domain-containing protein [Polyangiaceae bacterium]
MRFARFAIPVVFAVVAWSTFHGCSSETSTTSGGRPTGNGSGGSTSGGAGGVGGTGGGTGGSTTGTGGTLPPIDPPKDAGKSDIYCVSSCSQYSSADAQTGQYCGRIGDNCGKWMECGNCTDPQFTCGGSGVKSLCGADRDGGTCTAPSCIQPTGQYCGVVGDMCGGSIDCGNSCNEPGWTCGGAGIDHVCGAGTDGGACKKVYTCNPPNGQYCEKISNGCGATLDCGTCPAGQVCGARANNVCGKECPLCKLIPKCEAGTTTLSGTVVTGAALNPDPVYNAQVFIPNGPPPAFKDGPSCDRCTPITSDNAVAGAITGPNGQFTLNEVPVGTDIPLVVQLGHWRYQTTINIPNPCVDNPLPAGTARLPRTQAEGNIPLTALATGDVDALECILRKIGVADTEFSDPTGSGRIHFYRNNGARYSATTPAQTALVDIPATWDRYDQILFPCEGRQSNETPGALTNFIDYTAKGGRAFTTHFSYTWLYQNGGFATAGTWQVNQGQPNSPLISNIDTSTPKGMDFATWLGLVGALTNPGPPPQVSIFDPRRNLNAVPPGMGGQQWIYSTNPAIVQHMVVDTPVNSTPDKVCGRVIYSDFHVANASNGNLTFPAQCPTNDLTPQEKILEFMLFDLASCIGPTTSPPPPPPPPN